MILVTGATGSVGSAVTQQLAARGAGVRAFVRDPARARAMLGEGVPLVMGDFASADTVLRALDGVDTLFLACANGPRQVEFEATVVEAATSANVRRLVKLSAALAEVGSPLCVADWNGRIERIVAASGLPAVILRPGFYMSNLLANAPEVRRTDTLRAPAGEANITMIDPWDVAACAVVALTEPVAGGSYLLTGAEVLSYRQIAQCLSEVTGRRIEFADMNDDEARRHYLTAGLPEWFTEYLVRLFQKFRNGAATEITDTVRSLIDRDPRSFSDFASSHAAVFSL
ncbi:MAG: SDR family oxidoreductase [Pseudonocardiaceae bacterium]